MISLTKWILIVLLCFVVVDSLSAQQDETSYLATRDIEKGETVPRFFDDFRFLVTSPARFDQQSLTIAGGLMAVTAAIMGGIDTPVYNGFRDNQFSSTGFMTAPGRLYDTFNPNLFAYGSSGLLIGTGYLIKDTKLAKTGWTAAEALLFTQVTTGLLKSTLGRKRPFVQRGNLAFEPVDFSDGNPYRSFPSGHTSKIFALSTVLASSYDTPWVRIPAYALAGSVALQRVQSGDHWVSDVVVGGALGYFIGRSLAKRNGLVKSDSHIQPVVEGGMIGLNIRF